MRQLTFLAILPLLLCGGCFKFSITKNKDVIQTHHIKSRHAASSKERPEVHVHVNKDGTCIKCGQPLPYLTW